MDKETGGALAVVADETISALKIYMADRRASQIAVARACGVSTSVISQVLRGEYRGDLEAILKRIQDFLTLEEERETALISPFFVETKQSIDAITVCQMVHRYNFIGLILARAGLGKTMSLKEYSRNNSNSVLITASTWNCSRGAIAGLLSRAVRVSTTYSGLSDAIELIIHRLGYRVLLMIDEAQHLTRETLEGIRYVNDVSGVGVVLSGTLSIASRISDKRIGMDYEQVASRIGIRRVLSERVEREDVRRIVERILPDFNSEIIDYCLQKANGPGAFRTMMRYLQIATDGAAAKKEPISVKHFRAAEEFLLI